MFERESRRERILEGKSREQRLKAKVHGSDTAVKPKTNQSAEFRAQAERDFFAIVNKVGLKSIFLSLSYNCLEMCAL